MPRVNYRSLPEEIYEEIDEVWHDLRKEADNESIERVFEEAQTEWLLKASEIISFRKSMQEYIPIIDEAFMSGLNIPAKESHFSMYISSRSLTDSYVKRGLIPV